MFLDQLLVEGLAALVTLGFIGTASVFCLVALLLAGSMRHDR